MISEVRKLVKFGEQSADCVQVNSERTKSIGIGIRKNSVESFDSSDNVRCHVKVWIKGKEGSSYSNNFNRDIVRRAIKVAKVSPKKEYFHGLPKKGKYNMKKLCDKNVENLDCETLVKHSYDLIKNVKNKDVFLAEGGINSTVVEAVVANSEGINVTEKKSFFSASISAVTKKNKTNMCWDSNVENGLFDISEFGKRLRQKVLFYNKTKTLATRPNIVILKPEPFAELLKHALLDNLNGENVEKKKSIFSDRFNEKIMSEDVSILDDGILKEGINSSCCDYEGVASRKTTLVKNGILKKVIYDYNTAINNNNESTGNASDGGIDFSNVVIKGPQNNVKNALVVESIIGAHTSNPITTDFSVKLDKGYSLNGGVKTPIKDAMLNGRVVDILNNIISIGKRVEQREGVYTGAVACTGIKVI